MHNWLIKKIINDHVRARLPTYTGAVVDLGCGSRTFEADILRYAHTYIGIDWGNSLHNGRIDVVADLNEVVPLLDESIDHAIALEVIEHLSEPCNMLREAHRILKSNGTLTLSAPFQWWVHEAPWDFQRFTRYGLEYQLHKAGFTEIEVTPTTGFWVMWVLKLNYQLARLVRGPKPIRLATHALLVPFWWLGQTVAPLLDRVWPEDRETAGYFVTARKP